VSKSFGVEIEATASPEQVARGVLKVVTTWLNEYGDEPFMKRIETLESGSLRVTLTPQPAPVSAAMSDAGLPRHL
jgi:hypothetical protein